MGAQRGKWSHNVVAIAAVVLMVAGTWQAGTALAAMSSASSPAAAAASTPTAAPAVTVQTSSHVEAPSLLRQSAATPSSSVAPLASGPHPGTIQAYEPVPGGATTVDPALAYDTTSYEVILNVYETLVSYNGSSTSSFVPTLATCVPGQGPQCAEDYGTGFTGIFNTSGKNFTGSNGVPLYWTFVIDPTAHFYDPSTSKSWGVYPSDVMFSIARTLAFSDIPYATKTSGWIMAQALLPPGKSSFDKDLHFPYDTTPGNILGSMLVNDSAYCPAKAMDGVHGHGCITFVANGSAQYWPEFLDFVEDNLGASVVPCGWFTYEDAGIPGWSGTSAANGDGSCKLPDGQTSTTGSTWTNYLKSLAPTSWDTFEKLNKRWPATQPNVRWSMVGSGPYYGAVTPGISYALAANPAYVQPAGCSGAEGLAKYTGYCDPAPGGYIPNVDVTWENEEEGDSLGTSAILAGTADFAGIYTTETSTLLGFVHSGLWQYNLFPTLSTAFTPINLGVSDTAYNTTFAGTPLEANPIPEELFTDLGLRNFYINAYPYTTVEDTINTVDNIQFAFNAGGPIPEGMGSYYPSNVSWPYERGDPTQPATSVGSAAWWWAELTTVGSPYYNSTLVTTCTTSHPCTWPIGYFDGAPANLALVDDWSAEIYRLSGHTLDPWPLAETFTQFLASTLIGPYESPLASVVGFGWAPDYPDPTDYVAPIVQPDGSYTAPDTVGNQLFLPQYSDNATCGHGAATFADLAYWAKQANDPADGDLNSTCQGVAYGVASAYMKIAGALPSGAQRILDYDLIEQITNALGLYVWNGQSNELVGFAPWIKASSINENPVIGGGGDSVWFHVEYNTVYAVSVTEHGLPSGTSWSATLGPTTLTSTSATIAFADQPNGTYNYSVSFQAGYGVSPSNGTITVAGAAIDQSVTYTAVTGPTATLSFNETGLVSGTTWAVDVEGYGEVSSDQPSISFALPQSTTYHYQALLVLDYLPPPSGGVALGTVPATVALAYTPTVAPTYKVTFTETGLAPGASWSVSIDPAHVAFSISTTSTNISFYETNGSYPVTFTLPDGYVGPATTATVGINGSALSVTVPCATTAAAFAVTFSEKGLTTGISWAITIDNLTVPSTTPSLGFTLPNAAYPWTLTPIPGWVATNTSGVATVAGKALAVSTKFHQYTFGVTFLEGGLPGGTVWNVTLVNGTVTTKLGGSSTTLSSALPNGSFSYTVSSAADFTPTPGTAMGTVAAGATEVVVVFSQNYNVSFAPSGLKSGTSWTVYFGGTSLTESNLTPMNFSVPNNTWAFSASASGYAASPAGGLVHVNGQAMNVTISFSATKASSTSLSTLAYAIIGVFAFLTLLGFGLAAHYAGRRPPATPPSSWSGEKGADGGTSGDAGGSTAPESKSP